jgi:hypothetical protein
MKIKITERGWPGHHICCDRCVFHRNTLVETDSGRRIVVSTVGNMRDPKTGMSDVVGHQRCYETMAFRAVKCGAYWEIDVSKKIKFESPWSIAYRNRPTVDLEADEMHETVVREIARRLRKGERL